MRNSPIFCWKDCAIAAGIGLLVGLVLCGLFSWQIARLAQEIVGL
jgi:hypothetical protein